MPTDLYSMPSQSDIPFIGSIVKFTRRDSTMNHRYAFGVFAVSVMALTGAAAVGDDIKSGPQVGDMILIPFHPMNVTGPKAGEKNCLI
jgi:hypothetical protein